MYRLDNKKISINIIDNTNVMSFFLAFSWWKLVSLVSKLALNSSFWIRVHLISENRHWLRLGYCGSSLAILPELYRKRYSPPEFTDKRNNGSPGRPEAIFTNTWKKERPYLGGGGEVIRKTRKTSLMTFWAAALGCLKLFIWVKFILFF